MIGAGIFFTPGAVAELLPHPAWIAAAWLTGGLISLAGALTFGELGAMYPRAGGDYVYLREGVHPIAGFLVGWITFFAIFAGTIAALAAALGEMLAARFGGGEAAALATAVAITVAVSAINYVGVRWGARANNLTSLIKIAALLAFGLLGPLIGEGDWGRLAVGPALSADGAPAEFSWRHFGLALSPVFFTYLGWNASIYVASEIRDPERNLPRSLVLGLGICAAVYVVVNAVYLYALPMDTLRGVENAGEVAAASLFGPVGGTLLAAFVAVSILGTLNAMVLVGPRIAYAMALDGLFFGGAERVNEAFRTPGVAIVVQGVVTVGLLGLLRTFPGALSFTTFAITLATMAAVVALYRLRRLRPDHPRPYRAWGYPWVPALYLASNAGVAAALVWGQPYECAISFGLLLAGLPFYWLFSRRRRGPNPRRVLP